MPTPHLPHRCIARSYVVSLGILFTFAIVLITTFVALAARPEPDRPRPSGRTVYALVNTKRELDLAFLRGAIEARHRSSSLGRIVVLDIESDVASMRRALCRMSEPVLCRKKRDPAQRQIVIGPNSTTQTQALIKALTTMCETGQTCGPSACDADKVPPGAGEFNVMFILGDVTMNSTDESATCDCECRARRTLQFPSLQNRDEATLIAERAATIARSRPGNVVILKQSWNDGSNEGYVNEIARDIARELEARIPGRVEQPPLDRASEVMRTLQAPAMSPAVFVPVTDETDGAREVIESLLASPHHDVPIVAPDTWAAATVQRRWSGKLPVCAVSMRETTPEQMHDQIDSVRRSFGADAYRTFHALVSGSEHPQIELDDDRHAAISLDHRPIWTTREPLRFHFSRSDDCMGARP